jgi:hypothetical protein
MGSDRWDNVSVAPSVSGIRRLRHHAERHLSAEVLKGMRSIFNGTHYGVGRTWTVRAVGF